MKKKCYLIVGLGNPGLSYEWSRHQAGYMTVDSLRRMFCITDSVFEHPDCYIHFLKPESGMNDSGKDVAAAIREIDPDAFLVVHDDVSLNLGRIRYQMSASAGGHNGVKSIITHLGHCDFARLKIGIGPVIGDLFNFVTVPIPKGAARENFETCTLWAAQTIPVWLMTLGDTEFTANRFNGENIFNDVE